MRSTFKILSYISKTKADDTAAILCRITIDGANVVITTGERTLRPNHRPKDCKGYGGLNRYKKQIWVRNNPFYYRCALKYLYLHHIEESISYFSTIYLT